MSQTVLITLIVVALVISSLTFFKLQGSLWFKIPFSLFRGGLFFIFFCIPVIEQPKILDFFPLKVAGAILLLAGMALVMVGSRKLLETTLTGAKGIPDRLVTDGIYGYMRHPINLGLAMAFIGWYTIFSGLYAFLFFIGAEYIFDIRDILGREEFD